MRFGSGNNPHSKMGARLGFLWAMKILQCSFLAMCLSYKALSESVDTDSIEQLYIQAWLVSVARSYKQRLIRTMTFALYYALMKPSNAGLLWVAVFQLIHQVFDILYTMTLRSSGDPVYIGSTTTCLERVKASLYVTVSRLSWLAAVPRILVSDITLLRTHA